MLSILNTQWYPSALRLQVIGICSTSYLPLPTLQGLDSTSALRLHVNPPMVLSSCDSDIYIYIYTLPVDTIFRYEIFLTRSIVTPSPILSF